MHSTPASLLERLRRPNDPEAWDRLVELYTPLLFDWARRVGLREPDAADLVQDVFTTLLQKLPQFAYNAQGSFRRWLRTVLLNKWREARRSRAAAVGTGAGEPIDCPGPDNVAELAEEEYRRSLSVRALQLMQAEFQPTTWKACWEHVACSRPAADVAAELGVSVNAVYLAAGRVLRRLREELEGLLD